MTSRRNPPPHSTTELREDLALRLSFIFTGGFLLFEGFQNWLRGRIDIHQELVPLTLLTYALAFMMLFLSTFGTGIIMRFRHMPLVSLIFIVIVSAYVISEVVYRGVYRTDAMAFTHYAAEAYGVKGLNPYKLDLQDALTKFGVQAEYLTLKPNGDFVTTLNYPALHFLVFMPLILIGVSDMRFLVIIFEIATFLVIYLRAARQIRPIVVIPFFAGSDLAINFSAGAVADFLWVLPLTLMIFSMNSIYRSAFFYGIACAIKQEPWLLAPFLSIWLWKEHSTLEFKPRLMRLGKFALISAMVFLLPNIKFILDGPSEWLSAVLTPVMGDLIVLSQGLSIITQSGVMPLRIQFYTIVSLAVFAALLANYYVYFDKLKHTIWIFPALILWFSYRGLQNYFIYSIPLLLSSLIFQYQSSQTVSVMEDR